MVESFKSIELINHKSKLQDIERFVEGICDELNIYNNYYGIINSSLTEIFEACCSTKLESTILKYTNSKGVISFLFENKSFMVSLGKNFNIESDEYFFNEDLNWLLIVKNLSDNLEISESGIKIGFSISSINSDMAVGRASVLNSFFESKRIKKAQLN